MNSVNICFNDDNCTHVINAGKVSYVCRYNDDIKFCIDIVIEGVPKTFMFCFDGDDREQVRSLFDKTFSLITKAMDLSNE